MRSKAIYFIISIFNLKHFWDGYFKHSESHIDSIELSSAPDVNCGGIRRYVFPNTQNTNANAQLYVHSTLFLRVSTLSTPAACLLLHRNPITHWLPLQLPLNSPLLSVFIRLRYMDDKLSWLRGWSSAQCSPQNQSSYFLNIRHPLGNNF